MTLHWAMHPTGSDDIALATLVAMTTTKGEFPQERGPDHEKSMKNVSKNERVIYSGVELVVAETRSTYK